MCQRIRHDHDPLFNHARHYVGPVAGSVRASVRAFAADLPQRKPALLRDARWPEPHCACRLPQHWRPSRTRPT